jgi:hypothetical protein
MSVMNRLEIAPRSPPLDSHLFDDAHLRDITEIRIFSLGLMLLPLCPTD